MTDTTGADTRGKAFIVTGSCMTHFRGPAIGVVFAPTQPGIKQLRDMGFAGINTVDQVQIAADAVLPKTPTLFLFERTPRPNSTIVTPLNADGSVGKHKVEELHPFHVVPALEGPLAQRHLRLDGLTTGDLVHPRAPAITHNQHGSRHRKSR